MMRNPDVTVRSRGVMEKCTYCVQRINNTRIDGEERGPADPRRRDQDRLPAGLPGRGHRLRRRQRREQPGVAAARPSARNYDLLAELNTRPRTSYLASLRNPNPELAGAEPAAAEPHHG